MRLALRQAAFLPLKLANATVSETAKRRDHRASRSPAVESPGCRARASLLRVAGLLMSWTVKTNTAP